jgi:hypothetical protein
LPQRRRSAVPPAVTVSVATTWLLQGLRIALLLLLPCACEHQAGTCACHDAQRTAPPRAAGAPPPHSRWFAPPPRHVLHCVSTTLLHAGVAAGDAPQNASQEAPVIRHLLGARTRRAERDPTCERALCLCANEPQVRELKIRIGVQRAGRARPIKERSPARPARAQARGCSNRTARSARDSGARIRSTVKSNTNLPLPLTCSAYRCVCAQRTIIPPREPQQQQGSNRKQRREPMQHG